MDNHFVPNLTLGLPVVERLAEVSELPLDVHLMIDDPDRWAPATPRPARAASPSTSRRRPRRCGSPARCAASGVRAGMALRPATPVEPYADLLGELDMLLLMTVEPGFGGQKFLDLVLPKIRTGPRAGRRAATSTSGSRSTAASARETDRALRRGRGRRVRGRLRGLRRRRPGGGLEGLREQAADGHRGLLVGSTSRSAG